MRMFIVYHGAFDNGYFLVEDPSQEDLVVLQQWHEACSDDYSGDEDEYDSRLEAADDLISGSWERFRVGTGSNPSMLANIDQVRFYGIYDEDGDDPAA
jgi:hypothetical protein